MGAAGTEVLILTDDVGATAMGVGTAGVCLSEMRLIGLEMVSCSADSFTRSGSPWVLMCTRKLSSRFAVLPHDGHEYSARDA